MALPPPSLQGRALRLLARREYSRLELERKLARHASGPAELAQVLDDLQMKGFIDAQRVLESVLHRRSAGLGAARIRHELNDKGLDADVVRDAVAGLQASELERAFGVWRKKFGKHHSALAPDAVARARQIRFLASRGFSGDTIRRVMSGVTRASDDNAAA